MNWRRRRSWPRWRPYFSYLVERDIQPWFITSFFDIRHPCYGQNKVSAEQYQVTISRAQVNFWRLTKCWLSIGQRTHVRLTRCKQGGVVRKPFNANQWLKVFFFLLFAYNTASYITYATKIEVNRKYFVDNFFSLLLFRVFWDNSNNMQKTSPQSYKTQLKILAYLGLTFRLG